MVQTILYFFCSLPQLASAFIVMSAPLCPPKSAPACACCGCASPVTHPPTPSSIEVELLRRLELDERRDNDKSLSNFSFVNQPLVVSSLGMTVRGRAAHTPPVATSESPLSMPLHSGGSIHSVFGRGGSRNPWWAHKPSYWQGQPESGFWTNKPVASALPQV
jgi:hypothetical protein